MFKYTDSAAEHIKLTAAQANGEPVLRVAAKTNSDGSIEYGMGFDEAKEGDTQVQNGGVTVVIDSMSIEILEETTLDYVEIEPGQFNFIFLNPLDPNYTPVKKSK
ncbi:MAG TPA: iron-sulfur cluster assembly accessory protein [Gammaproteobacteria bacterium]|nr:iron-sulfur cluster assembly accessory protein [Gammaproteobacteria bacterium]